MMVCCYRTCSKCLRNETEETRGSFRVKRRTWLPRRRCIFAAVLILSMAALPISAHSSGDMPRTIARQRQQIDASFWVRLSHRLRAVVPKWMATRHVKKQTNPSIVPLFMEDLGTDVDAQLLQENETKTTTGSVLTAAIHSILSQRHHIALWSLKAVQFYLLWFLTKSVWQALNEAMEEFSQESLLGMGGEPLFCSRHELPRLLKLLEQTSTGTAAITNDASLISRTSVQLALDLKAAGLPVRSSIPGRSSIESLFQDLTCSEASIIQQCLWRPPSHVRQRPEEMWSSVLGLDDVKDQILLTLAATSTSVPSCLGEDPFTSNSNNQSLLHKTQQTYASLLRSSDCENGSSTSTSQHHGFLLYGEPGCGKTFLIQALAAKCQWPCLVVKPSVLLRKYVGDTNLKVRSLFTLLQNKLTPCIVVLDELDGLFRERHDQENDVSRELKTEFLQCLSGIMTSNSNGISQATNAARHPLVVIGATNRPLDVDSAILRRLPQRYYIGLPGYNSRYQLICRWLHHIPLAEDFQIDVLAHRTEGYSPSDIRQLLQTAVRTGPIREALVWEQHQQKGVSHRGPNDVVRPLGMQDALNALSQVHATPLSPNYRRALQEFASASSDIPSSSYHHDNSLGFHFMNGGTVQVPDTNWDGQHYHNNEEYDDDDDDDDDGESLDEYDFDDDL